MMRKSGLILLLAFIYIKSYAQPCTTLGQTPASAFPVCGTDVFQQTSVPVCGGTTITAPGCTNAVLSDMNPYWYRFTCFTAGTLGFVITPNNIGDDYDWQLFDITGRNPNDVYSVPSLFVACNWSGETGITGASNAGNSLTVCATTGSEFRPLFSSMPNIILGHEYILLISHFSGSDQSGYALSFGGGTASITDPIEPALLRARAICDGLKMTVKLNKKMKCSSLNADGSDFAVTPAFAPIIAAEGVNCNGGFDMDSVILTLASPVPPGNYTITVKNDVNAVNLLDNCNRTIPLGQNLTVTVFPLIPTPMDSLTKIGCAPDELELVFNKPMLCNTVAPDGSDFIVTGPTAVTVASAAGYNCSTDGLSNIIKVKLSASIQTGGAYRITLRQGSDGNTVSNECSMETAAGSFINFSAADTVNANFTFNINFGCKADVVDYSHPGGNGVNKWLWAFDDGITSTKKDTSITYTVFTSKKATLIVSNGVCWDTAATDAILLNNNLDAVFENTAVVCPGDPAIFREESYNRVVSWQWDFGNGNTSTAAIPPAQFYTAPNDNSTRDIITRLIVTNDIGCSDTAYHIIKVVGNCFIAVPKAFSPNGDGLNEYLYPTNAYKAKDLYFAVYNRNGNKLFETHNWQVKWDGTYKGNPQDPGTYVWLLQYTLIDTGERYNLKGSTVLLR
jgi:gliding motility-associated-like protein